MKKFFSINLAILLSLSTFQILADAKPNGQIGESKGNPNTRVMGEPSIFVEFKNVKISGVNGKNFFIYFQLLSSTGSYPPNQNWYKRNISSFKVYKDSISIPVITFTESWKNFKEYTSISESGKTIQACANFGIDGGSIFLKKCVPIKVPNLESLEDANDTEKELFESIQLIYNDDSLLKAKQNISASDSNEKQRLLTIIDNIDFGMKLERGSSDTAYEKKSEAIASLKADMKKIHSEKGEPDFRGEDMNRAGADLWIYKNQNVKGLTKDLFYSFNRKTGKLLEKYEKDPQ
jgi:hypothetical protein